LAKPSKEIISGFRGRDIQLANNARQDKLVLLVEKMLTLMPKLRRATSESGKSALQNAVTTTDAKIDRLVYELYARWQDTGRPHHLDC